MGAVKGRSFVCLALLVLAGLAPRRAVADGPALAVGDTGTATCVAAPDLADALRRSGLVVDDASATRVEVAGTPAALVVSIRGAITVDERLAPATCNTATDVVAAFVASSLAPPPVVAVPTDEPLQ